MNKVIPFPGRKQPPSREELVARIRVLAFQTANMRMNSPHLRLRMAERNITMRQMLEVIRNGEPNQDPTLDEYGDWRIRLVRKVAGRRVQVVVAVSESYISPVTVI
ncbi:MAG: DUF4258 domain-containing protein [Alphaproteobacteria bacterium]|nr:DUF4258 domain-containing protein [Alphaproteobacteria bacterium]